MGILGKIGKNWACLGRREGCFKRRGKGEKKRKEKKGLFKNVEKWKIFLVFSFTGIRYATAYWDK